MRRTVGALCPCVWATERFSSQHAMPLECVVQRVGRRAPLRSTAPVGPPRIASRPAGPAARCFPGESPRRAPQRRAWDTSSHFSTPNHPVVFVPLSQVRHCGARGLPIGVAVITVAATGHCGARVGATSRPQQGTAPFAVTPSVDRQPFASARVCGSQRTPGLRPQPQPAPSCGERGARSQLPALQGDASHPPLVGRDLAFGGLDHGLLAASRRAARHRRYAMPVFESS